MPSTVLFSEALSETKGQTADVAFELDERVGRENAFEERGIMLHDFGKFDQRKHGTPP